MTNGANTAPVRALSAACSSTRTPWAASGELRAVCHRGGLACVIVVVAVNYIFKHKKKKRAIALEYALLFPWLLPTI
jgi:hypothetical protein